MIHPERLKELLRRFQTTRPASPDEIEAFEREPGITLPSDYCEFMRFTDGGEGFIGVNSYAMIGELRRGCSSSDRAAVERPSLSINVMVEKCRWFQYLLLAWT